MKHIEFGDLIEMVLYVVFVLVMAIGGWIKQRLEANRQTLAEKAKEQGRAPTHTDKDTPPKPPRSILVELSIPALRPPSVARREGEAQAARSSAEERARGAEAVRAQRVRREREAQAARSRAEKRAGGAEAVRAQRVRREREATERRAAALDAAERRAGHTLLEAEEAARREIAERVAAASRPEPPRSMRARGQRRLARLAEGRSPAARLFLGSVIFPRRSPWCLPVRGRRFGAWEDPPLG